MASSNKRERELARARHEAWLARRSARAQQQRRRQKLVATVVALVLVVGGVGWFLISHRSDSTTPVASDTTGGVTCTAPVAATKKTQTWAKPPANTLTAGATYTITLETNCGSVVIASNPTLVSKAGTTVNSQQFLTTQHFFDAASCFRLTTSGLFVLQCGSPTNNGQGGPGYTIPDQNLPKDTANNYPVGTVAMANSGASTNGSQFFLVYKDTTLPPNYTIWGKVVSGLDVLQHVGSAGVTGGSSDGAPAQPLVITKATAANQPTG